MKLAITMTAYRRYDYTRQVLDALAKCHHIDECLFLPNVEPDYEEIVGLFSSFVACETRLSVNSRRLGLNLNARAALQRAWDVRVDGIIHLEDDTVPSPDALGYFQWGLEEFSGYPNVFSISGYNRPRREPIAAQAYECRFRPRFTCWGWAVTRRHLEEILKNWSDRNPKSFAWHLNLKVRAGRVEVHPQLSRIQNIGYEHGENGRSAEWYRIHHRTPWVAEELDPAPYHLRSRP